MEATTTTAAATTATAPAQIPPAQVAPTPPAAPPAHPVQAAPTAQTSAPASPAPGVTTPKTAAPTAPATTPTVADPVHDVIADTSVSDNSATPASPDPDPEAMLSGEIKKLWLLQKDGKTAARRSRADLKALRLELGAKLHAMKALLARPGRGGNWASYLRTQKLPLATADKYVAEHAASLTPPEVMLLTEEFLEPVDQVRHMAQKLLPKLCRVLTTAELAFAFIDELFWNLEASDGRETDDGLEVFRTSHEDAPEVDAPVAELASSAPAVP